MTFFPWKKLTTFELLLEEKKYLKEKAPN